MKKFAKYLIGEGLRDFIIFFKLPLIFTLGFFASWVGFLSALSTFANGKLLENAFFTAALGTALGINLAILMCSIILLFIIRMGFDIFAVFIGWLIKKYTSRKVTHA